MERIENDVSKAKNLWQAEKSYLSILEGMSSSMATTMRGLDLKYEGVLLKNSNWKFVSPMEEIDHPKKVDDDGNPIKINVKTLTFYPRGRSGPNASRATSWQRETDEVYSSHRDYLKHCFVYNDTGRGVRPTIDYNFPNRDTKLILVQGSAEGWEQFKDYEIARGFNPKGFRLASKLLPKPKRPRRLADKASIAYLRRDRRLPQYSSIKSNSYTTTYGEHSGKDAYYVLASNYQLSTRDHNKMQELRSYVKTGILEPIDILVLNKNRQGLMTDETNWKHFSEYVKVDPKVVADKRKQVYRVLYYTIRYNRMYNLVSEHCSDSVLYNTKRWRYGTKSGYGKTLSWKGLVVRDSVGVQQAIDELNYFITTYMGNFLNP